MWTFSEEAEAAESWARERGATLMLDASAGNADALRFYEQRHGYLLRGVLMTKELEQDGPQRGDPGQALGTERLGAQSRAQSGAHIVVELVGLNAAIVRLQRIPLDQGDPLTTSLMEAPPGNFGRSPYCVASRTHRETGSSDAVPR